MSEFGPVVPIVGEAVGATTADLIARVRDLMAEEHADLYVDATEVLPVINDGKNILFASADLLPRVFDEPMGTGEVVVADLGRMSYVAYKVGTALTVLVPVHVDEIEAVSALAAGTPRYYTTDLLAADGSPLVKTFPAPSDGLEGSLYGHYFGIPPDLSLPVEGGAEGQNPVWHSPYHYLPCYHAAAILLRKDRRPEAAADMEARFRLGIVEYQRWYLTRFPYRSDTTRSQPSPNEAGLGAYPDTIG